MEGTHTFLRILGIIILSIAFVTALTFGGFEVWQLTKTLATDITDWNLIREHLRNFMFVGADLAVLICGWKDGRDYIETYGKK